MRAAAAAHGSQRPSSSRRRGPCSPRPHVASQPCIGPVPRSWRPASARRRGGRSRSAFSWNRSARGSRAARSDGAVGRARKTRQAGQTRTARCTDCNPPPKGRMHIPRALVCHSGGTGRHSHSLHCGGTSMAHSAPYKFGALLPTSAGRVFPGASPYLKRSCIRVCATDTATEPSFERILYKEMSVSK